MPFAREPPEPESAARVVSDTESICARYKKGNFNSWGQLAVSSRRWMGILHRMEVPDPDISHAAECEAARLMRQAAQRPKSACTTEVVASRQLLCDLLDGGASSP
jgi:hypothetical protein